MNLRPALMKDISWWKPPSFKFMKSNLGDLSALISGDFQNNDRSNVRLVQQILLCFICCLTKDMVLYIASYEVGFIEAVV